MVLICSSNYLCNMNNVQTMEIMCMLDPIVYVGVVSHHIWQICTSLVLGILCLIGLGCVVLGLVVVKCN